MREGTAENRRGVLLKRSIERQPQVKTPQATLWGRRGKASPAEELPVEPRTAVESKPAAGPVPASRRRVLNFYDAYKFAFGTIWVFTFTLYMRPNDLLPIGTFPVAKIIAIVALFAYINAQMNANQPLINRTTEAKMVYVLLLLAIFFIPAAASPTDSINMLNETFSKVVIIFVMMASVISTRERLESIIRLTVICGAILAFFAIKSYAMGSFDLRGVRIVGLVKGIFENPNDLATALCMLFPLAISLMLNRKGFKRFFYLACALTMVLGIFATFSRGGFLGVFAVCLFMAWKFGGKRRVPNLIGAAILLVGILMVLPGGYRNRVVTIFNSDQDETGSAQARTELLHRGIEVFMRRPIVGVGMGNFHIFSVHEHVAHNGYVEIAAELGIFGLLAYLTILIKPFRRLLRVEKDLKGSTTDSDRWLRYLNIGLQAQLVAYIVTSFFLSIQYLWYLYYAAAYAIVLQQIHLNERAKEPVLESPALPVEDQSKALALRPKKNEGALWSS